MGVASSVLSVPHASVSEMEEDECDHKSGHTPGHDANHDVAVTLDARDEDDGSGGLDADDGDVSSSHASMTSLSHGYEVASSFFEECVTAAASLASVQRHDMCISVLSEVTDAAVQLVSLRSSELCMSHDSFCAELPQHVTDFWTQEQPHQEILGQQHAFAAISVFEASLMTACCRVDEACQSASTAVVCEVTDAALHLVSFQKTYQNAIDDLEDKQATISRLQAEHQELDVLLSQPLEVQLSALGSLPALAPHLELRDEYTEQLTRLQAQLDQEAAATARAATTSPTPLDSSFPPPTAETEVLPTATEAALADDKADEENDADENGDHNDGETRKSVDYVSELLSFYLASQPLVFGSGLYVREKNLVTSFCKFVDALGSDDAHVASLSAAQKAAVTRLPNIKLDRHAAVFESFADGAKVVFEKGRKRYPRPKGRFQHGMFVLGCDLKAAMPPDELLHHVQTTEKPSSTHAGSEQENAEENEKEMQKSEHEKQDGKQVPGNADQALAAVEEKTEQVSSFEDNAERKASGNQEPKKPQTDKSESSGPQLGPATPVKDKKETAEEEAAKPSAVTTDFADGAQVLSGQTLKTMLAQLSTFLSEQNISLPDNLKPLLDPKLLRKLFIDLCTPVFMSGWCF